MLTARERERVLSEWNDTGAAAAGATIGEAFAGQVAALPGGGGGGVRRSRAELCRLDAAAAGSRPGWPGLGVRPEDRVGVLIGRSADLVVAELGIAMAGGAYLPLDARAPAAADAAGAGRGRRVSAGHRPGVGRP